MGFLQNIGDAVTNALGNGLLKNEVGNEYDVLKSQYISSEDDDPQAHVNKLGPVPGTYSLFNPFRIFRYSNFGMNDQDYARDMHFDSKSVPDSPGLFAGLLKPTNSFSEDSPDAVTAAQTVLKSFKEAKKKMENPTASDIIRWSHGGTALSPVPYSPQDFIWCKYYGKVPNNRMVTLRRYPMPIEDDIRIHKDKAPAVPIAQAVTWYGSDIDNDLNKMLNISWGLNWSDRNSEVNDIAGNEISVEKIAEAAGLTGPEKQKIIDILKAQVFSENGTQDTLKLSGYDTEIQEYIRAAYGSEGPYWNRILGPVNVVDKTLIRDRGFKDTTQNPIIVKFEYSLRSHGGINPKIAFLDLLTNILSLTYNTAPFWGGGARYFQTTGVTTPNFGMENSILDGDVPGGLKEGAEYLAALAQKNINSLVEFAKEIAGGTYNKAGGGYDDEAIQEARRKLDTKFKTAADPISKMIAPRLGKLMRKPLIYRAILDGRAVGEWHLTVGNPMNPIAMIGNLCLDNVEMKLGETLGIDDFPTEFSFTVTLKHGRPRAKQDIESMFNLGQGRMAFDQLAPPSSSLNSYGDSNTRKQNALYEGIDPENAESSGTISTGANTDDIDLKKSKKSVEFDVTGGAVNLDKIVGRYRRQVGNLYGSFYEDSPVLTDYFKQLKTQD
jgi:hypothetical protein